MVYMVYKPRFTIKEKNMQYLFFFGITINMEEVILEQICFYII